MFYGLSRLRMSGWLAVAFLIFASATWSRAAVRPMVLTRVQQIRSLTLEQAKQSIPVHVRGVVTIPSGYGDIFFLQDATAGIAVHSQTFKSSANLSSLKINAGDLVDIEGVSAPGLFAPTLYSSKTTILSKAELPKPSEFRLSQLTGGRQDSQWLAVRGVIRSAEAKSVWNHHQLILTVDTGEGLISAHVLSYTGNYRQLINADVLIEGVCGTVFNDNRQFVGIRMYVPSLREIVVEKPGGSDPFDCPLRPLTGLLQFGQDTAPFHRVKVRGTVTYQRPGDKIYLQHGSETLLVRSDIRSRLPLGTEIEAAGFAGTGKYSPELQNVVFRILGKNPVPEPKPIQASQLVHIKDKQFYIPYDGLLVRMDGIVEGITENRDDYTLFLNDGSVVVPVKIPHDSSFDRTNIPIGSVMRVTGINAVITNQQHEDAESFEILARSVNDLRILKKPFWWNLRHTLLLLSIAAFLMLIAFGWIYLQRRRIERQKQALLNSARMFQSALENVPLLALGLDLEGRVTDCNELLLKLLGRTSQEVIGLNWQKSFVAECIAGPEKLLVDLSFSQQLHVTHQEHIRSRDGSLRFVSWFNAVLHDADGKAIGTIALGEDISERKRAEEELSNAVMMAKAASKAKSEFLANMSHEIRTPMNGILGMTGLLLQSELTVDQRENLEMIGSSAEALLTIINDILDFSKVEAGKLVLECIPFNLEDLLCKVVSPLKLQAGKKGLQLVWSMDPQLPHYIMGDPGRLRQVLLNLLGNALKFTKQGRISVHVQAGQLSGNDRVHLHFTVKDTGIGIPPAQQQKIFDAFSQADTSITREFGGTGLGLSICAKLVQLFGGRIWVESEPGVGSAFSFTGNFSIAAAPVITSPGFNLEGASVLFVHDHAGFLPSIQQAAETMKLQLIAVNSKESALIAFEQSVSAGNPYSLVVLDLQLSGADNFAFAERVRSSAGPDKTKLIMLVLHGWRGDSARCAQFGISGYLQKPVDHNDLQRAIVEVMRIGTDGENSPVLVTRHSLRESRRRILLAEDNVVNQRLAVKLIERQGHTVVVAQNGREAVEALDRESFDLVLMDMQMPVMDGIEATAQIRHKEKETGTRIKIVALTANAMSGDREKCLAADMDGYLSKPIKLEELYAVLN